MAARGSSRYVVDEFEQAVTRVVQGLTLDIVADLQEKTPVDTGWARANWIPNIGGQFSDSPVGQRIKGSIDVATQQTAIAKIATQFRVGPPIHITNNVPYIQKLNKGTSKQAPAGYVDSTIEKNVKKYGGRKIR
jgi:uncharacterized protein CbrC (UPF0167 family)